LGERRRGKTPTFLKKSFIFLGRESPARPARRGREGILYRKPNGKPLFLLGFGKKETHNSMKP